MSIVTVKQAEHRKMVNTLDGAALRQLVAQTLFNIKDFDDTSPCYEEGWSRFGSVLSRIQHVMSVSVYSTHMLSSAQRGVTVVFGNGIHPPTPQHVYRDYVAVGHSWECDTYEENAALAMSRAGVLAAEIIVQSFGNFPSTDGYGGV